MLLPAAAPALPWHHSLWESLNAAARAHTALTQHEGAEAEPSHLSGDQNTTRAVTQKHLIICDLNRTEKKEWNNYRWCWTSDPWLYSRQR